MAKAPRNSSSDQGDLFQHLAALSALEAQGAQDLDIGLELRGALNTAIRAAKRHGWSRERIVERMNLCLPDAERAVTKRQLDAWTAASKEFHEFPARYLPAFCWATQCDEPARVLASAIGFDLVDARERLALQLGQARVDRARLSREERELLGKLLNR